MRTAIFWALWTFLQSLEDSTLPLTRKGRLGLLLVIMPSESGSTSRALPLRVGVSGTSTMTVVFFMPALDDNILPIVPAAFVPRIRLINASDDSAPATGAEFKRRVANLFPPCKLFSRDMMVFPKLHVDLIEWLNYWRADISLEDSPNAAMELASQQYEDEAGDGGLPRPHSQADGSKPHGCSDGRCARAPCPRLQPIGSVRWLQARGGRN